MRVPNTIIYHAGCMDGFTAAWIAWLHWGDYPTYVPAGYDSPIDYDHFKNKDVLILDFSYRYDTLMALAEVARTIVIVDHHKSAKDDLEQVRRFYTDDARTYYEALEDTGNVIAAFDMNRSGSLMTWDLLNGNKPAPMLVQHVNDRDLWKFEIEGSAEVHALMTSHDFDFETWSDMARKLDDAERRPFLIATGAAINRKLLKDMRAIADANTRFLTIDGIPVPACNMPGHLASDAGHYLCDKWLDFTFAATFYLDGEGRAKFSLRSRGDFDVSAVAAKFGGGGHRSAAGFTIPMSQISDFINDK